MKHRILILSAVVVIFTTLNTTDIYAILTFKAAQLDVCMLRKRTSIDRLIERTSRLFLVPAVDKESKSQKRLQVHQ